MILFYYLNAILSLIVTAICIAIVFFFLKTLLGDGTLIAKGIAVLAIGVTIFIFFTRILIPSIENSFPTVVIIKNNYETILEAVMHTDKTAVNKMIQDGVDLEAQTPSSKGYGDMTALIAAAKTDQFIIANILLDAGADIYAADQFGWTAGYAASTSRLVRGPEFEAKEKFIQKLYDLGYPNPIPHKSEVKQLIEQGEWPPE